MGSRSGFDADLALDEIQRPVDNGSGAISIAQRQANALVNLGLAGGTAANFNTGGLANGTIVTPGTAQASTIVVLDANKNFSGLSLNSLLASTATVPSITIPAGTLLTTAGAGVIENDGTAFYATVVASARQQVDAEQYINASANSATYNNTGLDTAVAAPVFTATTNPALTAGAVTLVAGKTYFFEFQYNLTNTGTTSHTWAVLFGGTATFTSIRYQVYGNSGTTANTPATGGLSGMVAVATAVVVTAASTSATEQVAIGGQGMLVVNLGGTLIPQMQASARPGATGTPGVVLLANSYFRIYEMGTNTQVGNWS